MRAMILDKTRRVGKQTEALRWAEVPEPVPGQYAIRIRVSVCAVCRTDLDEIEGRAQPPRFPVIPGHQVVGVVDVLGPDTGLFRVGDRVGVAWIHYACGRCQFCKRGSENLCSLFVGTGRDVDGGYAEFIVVPEIFAHAIPAGFTDAQAAPLLCAGAIGYRAFRMCGLRDGQGLGLMGFGASAHLVLQMARHVLPKSRVYVFARSRVQRTFARQLGAYWVGGIDQLPRRNVEGFIDTTPAWRPLLHALACLRPGCRLVINAIHKDDRDRDALSEIDYAVHLWKEKEIKSVTNVTRADVREFLELAARASIRPEVEEYALQDANRAICELKAGKSRGAKVLRVSGDKAQGKIVPIRRNAKSTDFRSP